MCHPLGDPGLPKSVLTCAADGGGAGRAGELEVLETLEVWTEGRRCWSAPCARDCSCITLEGLLSLACGDQPSVAANAWQGINSAREESPVEILSF